MEELREITYTCRDIGYGVEEGEAFGHWGERDWSGKREFIRDYTAEPSLYLFDDEITSDEEWDGFPDFSVEEPVKVYLGDYVRDDYDRLGRVYAIHHHCPESESWIRGQNHPVSAAEREGTWVSILNHNHGASVSPESRLVKVEPFELINRWEDFYFQVEVGAR